MGSQSSHSGTTIAVSIPVSHPELFRHSATADVLAILADTPETAYGIRELGRMVETTHRSVSAAVDSLEAAELVETSSDGPKRLVQINTARLRKPDDPILSIPQPEFYAPVRALVDELTDALDDICAVVIFGSVARGEADRQSDIDCFVLVEKNQATAQRTAHELVKTVQDRRYNGERYTFQVLVESVDTAATYGERLRKIIAEGITLHDSPQFRTLREEVRANG